MEQSQRRVEEGGFESGGVGYSPLIDAIIKIISTRKNLSTQGNGYSNWDYHGLPITFTLGNVDFMIFN